jgi:hypothetical protein
MSRKEDEQMIQYKMEELIASAINEVFKLRKNYYDTEIHADLEPLFIILKELQGIILP